MPNAANSYPGSDQIRRRGDIEGAQRTASPSRDLSMAAIASDNPLNRDPAPRCGNCGSLARAALNPFYGTGLAVHQYLLLCQRCDWTGVLTAPSDPEETCVTTEVASHRFLKATHSVSAFIARRR